MAKLPSCWRVVLLAWAVGGLVIGAAYCQENAAAPDADGLIVLKNGGILTGMVTKAGDYYLLTRGDDSEVRLPVGDVEFTCRDLDAAYAIKRDAMKRDTAREHLLLAQWCLRHDLTARAADQILAAWNIDPEHPAIRGFEERLHRQVAVPTAPVIAQKAQTASFVSLTEIEESLATLEPAAVEQFTIEIQPLLLNRCGNATCHGQASPSNFALDKPTGKGTMTRRFTQRNLYSTLRQVDRQYPENSPLLTIPAGVHGGADDPVLGQLDGNISRQLMAWVKKTASGPDGGPPLTIRRAEGALLQADNRRQAEGVALASGEIDPDQPAASRAIFEQSESDDFRPRDEFDPAIFNRLPPASSSAAER